MELLAAAALLLQEEALVKLIRTADEHYVRRAEDGRAQKAVEAYKKAIVLDESRVESYWKLARAYYWLGSREKESARAAPLYREGIDFLKIAVSIDGESIHARFWLATMYGLFGQAKGILQSLDLVEPMKAELEWVLKKDETFEQAAAHRVMARLLFKLPGFQGGDNEKAKKHLARAIEIAPKNLLNYLYLAEIHYSEHRRKEAKETLLKLQEQPDDPDWLPECKDQREDAKRLLAALEKE